MTHSIGQKFTPLSLLKFAFPSIIMMIFMSLYTIIDGVFISRFLGDNALSAANIVYPVINILMAVGIMLATGGSAVVAKKIGEGKNKEAREDFSMLIATGVAASILLVIITLLFLEPICRLLGANDALIDNCIAYLRTVMFFAPACMLQSLFQSFFVAAGKPHIGLSLTIIAGIANAVLDYVFLVPFELGIQGAALATGIGQLIPALFGLLYFFIVKKELYLTRFHFHAATLLQASSNGASEMVTNLSNAIITYLFNLIMIRMVGESGVAAITIILYAQFLFNALYLGFSMGVAPIFSYHHGSGNTKELKNVYRICCLFVILSSVSITLLSYVMAKPVVQVFVNADTATYALAINGFFLFSLSFLFSGFNIFSSALFTAFSDGKSSAIISFARTFLLIVVALLTLPALLGINGVWLAIPVAEFITIFLSVYFHWHKRHLYHYLSPTFLPR